MKRRTKILFLFVGLAVFLSGCSVNQPINPNNGPWDKYAVYPLSQVLDWIASHVFAGSYGLAILVVTIGVRLLLLPLTVKQYKSSKKMQDIQPELKKLKEQYKDDAKKQQEETMKLFQQNGVNPLAGCFPLIIQMPVFIALYHAVMRDANIKSASFLWMQLGHADPYYILPIIAAITTFFQQKMMSNNMSPQMRNMMFIYPVLIFVMAMKFASALPLYWIYSNLFTIVQTYFIYGKNRGAQSK